MLKCLCCRGSSGGRHKGAGGGGGGGGGSKFSLESDPEKAGGDSPGRYRRKKLDDEPDRVDAGAHSLVGVQQRQTPPQPARPPQQQPVPVPVPVARQPELATTGISVQPPPIKSSSGYSPDFAETVEAPRRVEVQHVTAPPQAVVTEDPPPVKVSSVQFRQSRSDPQEQHNDEIEVSEIEIVDSDFEEEEAEEEVAELKQPVKPVGTGNSSGYSGRSTATLSVVIPRQRQKAAAAAHVPGSVEEDRVAAERLSTFLLAAEDEDEDAAGSVWQSLPSSLKPSAAVAGRHHLDALIEEEPIFMRPLPGSEPRGQLQQAEGIENAAFSPGELSLAFASVDDPTARASLLALDRALAVFELAEVDDDAAAALGLTAAGGREDEASGFVDDEEMILPLSSGRD